jgi:Spx/MgsR family transcriptional regulator
MITLYGIPNCDKVRKARRWLDDHGVAYRFHDFRKDGVDEARLRAWVGELGWETLLNRTGTTWRSAPGVLKAGIDAESAIAFMLQAPPAIKRPVLDTGRERVVGFSDARYESLFGRR